MEPSPTLREMMQQRAHMARVRSNVALQSELEIVYIIVLKTIREQANEGMDFIGWGWIAMALHSTPHKDLMVCHMSAVKQLLSEKLEKDGFAVNEHYISWK